MEEGVIVREHCDHILFIGFSGAGKSTIVRNLSSLFHRQFIDVDRLVERRLHQDLRDIFRERGEQGFRDEESRALADLRQRKSLLVACGSGLVDREANRVLVRELGHVVWLKGTLEDSLRQMHSLERRPDMTDPSLWAETYQRRLPIYEALADDVITITGKSFQEVAEEAGSLLWEEGLI